MAARRRFIALPSVAVDTLLTLLAASFAAASILLGDRGPARISNWAIVLAVLCASSLLLRSRRPVGALLAVGTLGSVYLLVTGRPMLAILPAVVLALYSAVAYSNLPRLKVWAIALGVCVALNAASAVGREEHQGPPFQGAGPPTQATIPRLRPPQASDSILPDNLRWLLLDSGWMLTALLLGEALRGRRAIAREAELRAELAEATQHETAQRRVAEERLRIARELHDVLAHTVALINVQAGVAAHVIDQQPEQAKQALVHIKEASRATLQELRALVGVLREGDSPAPLAPAPGLGALDELVGSVREAGLAVEVEETGRAAPLPATVDTAAYRILQESLTNAIKHAGRTTVRVTIERAVAALDLVIESSRGQRTAAAPADGSGHGIVGMRERAAALGGSLEAGPTPDGGFRVHATLPIPGGAT